ncbi:MAG TPA: hypothetical protein VHB49_23360 [Bradyrhizobium sp.]|nr:hypothetical protein [Bradyrhizobium sp.]
MEDPIGSALLLRPEERLNGWFTIFRDDRLKPEALDPNAISAQQAEPAASARQAETLLARYSPAMVRNVIE